MKRFLIITILLATSFLGLKNLNALELNLTSESEQNYSFELTAVDIPSENLNSVKLYIVIENGSILNFSPLTNETVLLASRDCGNSTFTTEKEICVTYLFSTMIKEEQSLGTFEVERTSADLSFSIKATGDSAYSGGEISYPISLTLHEEIVEQGVADKDPLAEISPEDLDLTTQTNTPPVEEGSENEETPAVTPINEVQNDSTTALAVILGVMILITLLALVYFVLKPKKPIQVQV